MKDKEAGLKFGSESLSSRLPWLQVADRPSDQTLDERKDEETLCFLLTPFLNFFKIEERDGKKPEG